ncbi:MULTISPECIES: DNA recombination protein RmuC [Pseudomonas]|uniref:DNA recombination protein RmuC n=1 Tax=Pseudomonas plecoglossicida TaxID=70775 RepID=A0ABX4TUU1_PSEDL|nr:MULTISPECIES: DNA recombination protein RmuC [Pseudomonas]PLU85340.1 DNA recombination protein RmuC [Pseudomonas plecoglossicida]PLU90260.1 DNA recombination protein RmuC [Pseudomonas plecoglossicida]PLV02673.1 DNA recombination protein RmuC [Pseudomonas plecoglossicida]PLV09479.1 DNA recombination protein RmuC [Pseudomonas plecoglossicida]
MENLVVLIISPLLTFIVAWVIASWRAQRNNQQLQIELEVTQADLTRVQAELAEHQATLGSLSGEKAALDIAYARLETERDSGKARIDRLEGDIVTQQAEIDRLRQSEQAAKETSSKAQEAAVKLQDQLASNSTAFKERLEEKDQRISGLDQKQVAAELQQTNTAKLLSESREALKKAQTQLEEKQVVQERFERDWVAQKAELETLRQTEKQAREVGATAQEAANKLKEQIVAYSTTSKERIEEKDQRITQLDEKLATADAAQKHTAAQLAEIRETLKKAQTQLEEKQEALTNYKTWWEQSKIELKTTQDRYAELDNSHGQLKISLAEKQQHFDAQLKLLQENREELTKEFERLANEVLERKGKAFKELNQESITNLLNPLHTEMKGFKAKVEDIHAKDAEQRIELRTELKNLQTLNKEITDQADKLTTALQGQKKVQGNWGELMLENVLDNSGLRLGIDYKREVSFTTEEGRQRPDAIVYLPQKQHLIIDAKTSLMSYTQYVNADNDLERVQALEAHTKAVSDRVNELADRDYFKLPGLNSPEVVIMFIPIESAYVEALKYDETLFQRAIERNVLVATPTTLLTSLNIVRQLWRFEDQNKHTAELANRAEKFYNKLNGFLTSMQGVGNQLNRARESYDKAFGQLYIGKGNLIKQAAEFKDLGVSVQKELPADLVERANLELSSAVAELEEIEATVLMASS